jgi:RimJ/RimL family protein N-acetyltransferase
MSTGQAPETDPIRTVEGLDIIQRAIAGFDRALELDGCRLRLVTPDDLDDLLPLFADWDVVRWLARPRYPVKRRDLAVWLESAGPDHAGGRALHLAVEVAGHAAGVVTWRNVGASIVQSEPGSSLGFWLGRAHWGQGLMTAAARAVIAEIFALTGETSVFSGFFDGNSASARVQDKLGFRSVGRAMVWCHPRREDLVHINTRLDREAFDRMTR